MAKELVFEKLTKEEAMLLLKAFDYDVDEAGCIVTPSGAKIRSDETPKEYLKLEEAALIPGSLDVIDGSAPSISKFIRERESKK